MVNGKEGVRERGSQSMDYIDVMDVKVIIKLREHISCRSAHLRDEFYRTKRDEHFSAVRS